MTESLFASDRKKSVHITRHTSARSSSGQAPAVTSLLRTGRCTLQTKLSIGSPDDKYEQEADRVADRVISMPAPVEPNVSSTETIDKTKSILRKCDASATEEEPLQRKSNSTDARATVTDSMTYAINAGHSSGNGLDDATRNFMEIRFGTDFSDVKLHTDNRAIEMSRQLNARAFTVGNDIFFNSGSYSPASMRGKHLLAHELVHVIQQRNGVDSIQRFASLPSAAGGAASSSGAKSAAAGLGSASISGSSATGDRSSAEGIESNGAGGGESPTGTCRVDVRATHISAKWMPFRHLFIVHEDAAGNVTAYRGGPGGGSGGGYGNITATYGPYNPSFIDWDPGAPSVRVLSGAAACGKDTCFRNEVRRIRGLGTPYAPTGPNSNTVVKTLLHNCGVPERIPVSSLRVPGWGDPVL